MKKINKKQLIIILISLFVFVIVTIFLFFNPFLSIKVNNNKIILNYKEKFKTPTYKVKYYGKDITKKAVIKNNVNTKKLGTYVFEISVKKQFTKKVKKIKVEVVDTVKPNIVLKGGKRVTVCPKGEYKEDGFTAKDNYDGDLTSKVKSKILKDRIIYSVNDSSDNNSEKIRYLNREDKESPTISFKNGNNIYLKLGTEYKEDAMSVDNCDGDLTSKINVKGSVDINKAGKYTLTFEVLDSSGNKKIETKIVNVYKSNIIEGPIYIKGILIVNKLYSIPRNFTNGNNSEAYSKFLALQKDASNNGHSIPFLSGFRSFDAQKKLYNSYVMRDGQAAADRYSAKPGHSEHETGLTFDIGKIDNNYGNTEAGTWLRNNCYKYGFIIRYPAGKEHITGYMYEPWHVRYVGVEHATNIMKSNLTLEEYLNVKGID